jgi:mitogen-activated protein kinase kinase kinase
MVEMMTGEHPFPGFNQMQAIFKIGSFVSPEIPSNAGDNCSDFLKKTFLM